MSPMDWKGPPSRGPGGIKDFEEVLQKIRERFKGRFRFGVSLWLLILAVLIVVGVYASVYTVAPEDNPPGPQKGERRIRRGGCHGMAAEDQERAARGSSPPFYRPGCIGFRCVRSLVD